MKVKDLLAMPVDVDVYDDVCDDIAVAFCGPMALTEEGAEVWGDVVEYDMHLVSVSGYTNAIIHVDGDDWKKRLGRAKDFFWSLAGYCPADDYERWFVEVDE